MGYSLGVAALISLPAIAAAGLQPTRDSVLPLAHLPQPTPIWFTLDDYPRDAVLQRMSGTVQYRLVLDTAGRVQDCSVLQSSGHDVLDSETCAILRRRVRLEPAQDAAGQATASQYVGTVRWLLPAWKVVPSERHTVWVELKNNKPVCSVDWNDGRRTLKPRICREFVSHISSTEPLPTRLDISGTPEEFGFKN